MTGNGKAMCSSPEIAGLLPAVCTASGGTAYTSTCTAVPRPVPVPQPVPVPVRQPVQATSPSKGKCDIFSDTCTSRFNRICNAGSTCPAGSDCFDCDPLQAYSNVGCETCVANGGRYCVTGRGVPFCNSPDIAEQVPYTCTATGGSVYSSTCPSKLQPVPAPVPRPVPQPVPVPRPAPVQPPVSSSVGQCDIFNDKCRYKFDLYCDAVSGGFCSAGSDCFDCDPFQKFRNSGCNACVAAGGRYCVTGRNAPICSSPSIAEQVPYACTSTGGSAYKSTCS